MVSSIGRVTSGSGKLCVRHKLRVDKVLIVEDVVKLMVTLGQHHRLRAVECHRSKLVIRYHGLVVSMWDAHLVMKLLGVVVRLDELRVDT